MIFAAATVNNCRSSKAMCIEMVMYKILTSINCLAFYYAGKLAGRTSFIIAFMSYCLSI